MAAPAIIPSNTAGPVSERYSEKADIWSLGCILAELCLGKIIFIHGSESEISLMACFVARLGPCPNNVLNLRGWSEETVRSWAPVGPLA
jgi:serine/threonine protein kinase